MSTKKETEANAKGFTAEEQAAMKARAKELKAEARANQKKADGESDVLAAIAEMPEPDRTMAARLHEIITTSAPDLWPKTWYGMPAFALDGKVVCFFQSMHKFNARYGLLDSIDAQHFYPTLDTAVAAYFEEYPPGES